MLAKLASTKALARTALQRLRPGAGGSGATPISLMAKTQSTSFAIVGATADTSKPAFAIMKSLMDEGFTVVPVNYSVAQAGGEILGRKAVAQVADCCGLEVVDIFNEENPYYMPM